MGKVAEGRLACSVPFCGRTVAIDLGDQTVEVVCAKHWRSLPLADRKSYQALQAEARSVFMDLGVVPQPLRDEIESRWRALQGQVCQIALEE